MVQFYALSLVGTNPFIQSTPSTSSSAHLSSSARPSSASRSLNDLESPRDIHWSKPCKYDDSLTDQAYLFVDVVKHNKASGRDKFAEPSNVFWPPTPRVWSQALSTIQRTSPPPTNDLPHSYAFPDAALFIGVKTPEKTFAYLQRWLAYHSTLIFRFLPHDSEASPLSGDHWRAFLSGSIDNVHDKDWWKEKKLSMQQILGNAVKDYGDASEEERSDIRFKGLHVSVEGLISTDVAQEVLWELSELNF